MLQAGDGAPDFQLDSTQGTSIRLYDVLAQSQAVLFFYPKAFTPVCTAEACGFREAYPHFQEHNSALFGISSDHANVATRFAERYRLPFPLLIDRGGAVRNLFGVPKLFGLVPGRATFVIAQDGIIRHVTVAGFQSEVHVNESLKWLEAGK